MTLLAVSIFALALNTAHCICTYGYEEWSSYGYMLEWQIHNEYIEFTLTKAKIGSFWTGIGFGSKMSDLDFIEVAHNENGTISITDMLTNGTSTQKMDSIQNVLGNRASYVQGLLQYAVFFKEVFHFFSDEEITVQARFQRPLNTGDPSDKQIIVNGNEDCEQKWAFPLSGGLISGGVPSRHTSTPHVVSVCNLEACRVNESSISRNNLAISSAVRQPLPAPPPGNTSQTGAKRTRKCPIGMEDAEYCAPLINELFQYGCESIMTYVLSCCNELMKRGCML